MEDGGWVFLLALLTLLLLLLVLRALLPAADIVAVPVARERKYHGHKETEYSSSEFVHPLLRLMVLSVTASSNLAQVRRAHTLRP